MGKQSKTSCIGILTSGGDCPGLNAAIRGVVKPALSEYGMKVIGVYDGFRGLVENRTASLESAMVSGILTHGGTILGTSRDKPHRLEMGGTVMDMTQAAVDNARRLGIQCLVCLGGGGTQKNALHLWKAGGLDVLTLPKTIDNDVARTDVSFGYDTALGIATEAIDRLHTTATSHHRMIVVEIMGHNAGWLALGAGVAGGADIILIPEIPYSLDAVVSHLMERRRSGKRFSIIAVAEGALSREEVKAAHKAEKEKENDKGKEEKDKKVPEPKDARSKKEDGKAEQAAKLKESHLVQESKASRLARQIQMITGFEVRVTSLGHVQRGGSPSPADRLLCTRLGTAAAQLLAEGTTNVMVGVKGDQCIPVPLEKVTGRVKTVPPDHPWVKTARLVGTCLGDGK